MIFRYLYEKIEDDELKVCLVAGLAASLVAGIDASLVASLAFGLVAGLAVGLAAGLAFGLVAGLAFGLVAGLAVGLVAGLAFGLVAGLAASLANLFQSDFYVNLLLLIIIIILSELLFLLDKSKPDKKINRLWFTLIHKGEAFFESCLIVINIVAVLSVDWSVVSAFLSNQIPILQQTLYCVGWGTLIVILVAGFIYLNSLRYKRGKQ